MMRLQLTSSNLSMQRESLSNDFVTPLDIADVVHGVLRHRIILNYKAEAAGINADDIVTKILQAIKLP